MVADFGHGTAGLADGAHPDGVNADVIEFGQLGGIERFNFTGVVDAVGEQDDHLALGFGFLQAIYRGGEPHANGGAAFEQTGLKFTDAIHHDPLVGGQWDLRECLAFVRHYTDAVIGSIVDKSRRDLLGGLESIGLKVLTQHGGRQVHAQDNVDAFACQIFHRR